MLVAEVRDLGVIACAKPLLHSYVPTPTRACARNCSTWVEADGCTLRAVHLIFHTNYKGPYINHQPCARNAPTTTRRRPLELKIQVLFGEVVGAQL